jgi:hypothetical protein
MRAPGLHAQRANRIESPHALQKIQDTPICFSRLGNIAPLS